MKVIIKKSNVSGDQWIGENFTIGSTQSNADILAALKKLQREVKRANKKKVIDEEVSTELNCALKKAMQQAKEPDGDKVTILQHMEKATKYLNGSKKLADAFKAVAASISMMG